MDFIFTIRHLDGVLAGIEQEITTSVGYVVGQEYTKAVTGGRYLVVSVRHPEPQPVKVVA